MGSETEERCDPECKASCRRRGHPNHKGHKREQPGHHHVAPVGLLREHHHADGRGDENQQRDGPSDGHPEIPAPDTHAQGEEPKEHGHKGILQDLVRAAAAVALNEANPLSVRLHPEDKPRARRAVLQLVQGHLPPYKPVVDQLRPAWHCRAILEGERSLKEEHVGQLGHQTVTLISRGHGDPNECRDLAEAPPANHVDQGQASASQSEQDDNRVLRQATHQPQQSDAHRSDNGPLVKIPPQHSAQIVH
mmetsp:Transcript_104058/g.238272  ORF Transcript_104058/g.238272 Transcript_104058/m.238272 type:complete len:249 (+) Transcript_104058:1146-1892(+)